MAKNLEQPDVSALKTAQDRLAELNVEEAKIFGGILQDTIARIDAIVERYADVPQFKPDAVNQAINHREHCRMLSQHLQMMTGEAPPAP
jgi:hypothetical protein